MNYPKWQDGIPHTNRNATINKYRQVQGTRAIEVHSASYRNATFDGIFELENQIICDDTIIQQLKGKIKVKVICSWYGCIPLTTYPQLDLTDAAGYKILDSYSGEVVDNIGD